MSSHHRHVTSFIDDQYLIEDIKIKPPYIVPGDIQPATCKNFGCGKTLTREEDLRGKLCINCQGKEKEDIMNFLKFK